MPRTARYIPLGFVQHVINRGNRRQCIFRSPQEYQAFLLILRDAGRRFTISLFAYCLMPNHWHLIVRPDRPRALSAYMHWLTSTHVRRIHQRDHTVGEGHIYQGRYRNIIVASDLQFLNACRYVEANPCRAGFVERADEWPYSSSSTDGRSVRPALTPWPVPKPAYWLDLVNVL